MLDQPGVVSRIFSQTFPSELGSKNVRQFSSARNTACCLCWSSFLTQLFIAQVQSVRTGRSQRQGRFSGGGDGGRVGVCLKACEYLSELASPSPMYFQIAPDFLYRLGILREFFLV